MSYNGLGNLNEGSGINLLAYGSNKGQTPYYTPVKQPTTKQGGSWWDNLFGGSKSTTANQAGLGEFFGSDTFKGLGTIAGIGTDIWGIMNQKDALRQAKRAWEAENARANGIMAMNREKYDNFKENRARLNSEYRGA